MKFSIANEVHLRTLQYVETLRIASKLANLNLLNGRGKSALDVGCGSGKGLLALKSLGYEVYGFDISLEHVLEARKLGFENVLQYDAQVGIPFNEDFDLITCFGVLEHLYEPEKALKNILSKSPEALIIDVPNKHTEFLRLAYLITFKRERIPASFSIGDGFLLRDKDHVNVKKPVEWHRTILLLLKEFSDYELRCLTNYFMVSLSNRIISIPLPLVGSSTLIVIAHRCSS